jgi:hypothetical protein
MVIGLITLMSLLFFFFKDKALAKNNQIGGQYDPYSNIRLFPIIDFFRTFWLTR